MSHMDELEKEISNAEKTVFGNPGEPATKPAESEEAKVEPKEEEVSLETTKAEPESTEVITQEEKPPEAEVQQQKQRTNWKKRYVGYKTATDATIHGLRQDIVGLNDKNMNLEAKVDELSKTIAESRASNTDAFKDLFTEEERDIVGDQTISSVQKATKAAVAEAVGPLQEELARVQRERVEDRKRINEREKTSLHGEFLGKLGSAVPDYSEIDTDPQFLSWMEGTDELSGMTKKQIFLQARDLGDVGRVAGFFNDYKAVRDGKGSEILEDSITPSKSSAPTQQPKEQKKQTNRKILESTIIKFYDDRARGLYKGRESLAKKYEEQINHAVATRNVIAGR